MKTAILAVEDRFDILDLYYAPLATISGVEVELADSKDEAIEKIRCKTFDIAFVDLALLGDNDDESGLDVIRALNDTDEGTSIIVVSANTDVPLAVRVLEEKITKYIVKEKTNPPAVRSLVKDLIVERTKRGVLPVVSYASLALLLSKSETPLAVWESRWTSLLRTDYATFKTAVTDALLPICPLLTRTDVLENFVALPNRNSCYGIFWSRRRGIPVILILSRDATAISPLVQGIVTGDSIFQAKYKSLQASVLSIVSGVPRSFFG